MDKYRIRQSGWFKMNPKKTLFVFLLIIFTLAIFATEKYLAHRNKTINYPKVKHRYILLREYPPFSDEKYTPQEQYLEFTDTLTKKEFRLRIDENGFIKPSKMHKNPDISIVFLGGSTTAGGYVEEQNRFPYLVGRIIEKKLNKKVNSYNSGVSGNNSMHSINILLNKIIPIQPDIVVMDNNINDLITLLYLGTYWNDYPTRCLITDKDENLLHAVMKKLKDNLIPNLYKQLTKSTIINNLRKRILGVEDSTDEWAGFRGKKLKINKDRFVNDFISSLQTFIGICKAWNIKPVLMTQANRLKENPDKVILMAMEKKYKDTGIDYKQFKVIFDLFNETIREVAKENNILLIDLANEIPQEKEYMYDTVHFNDKGSQFATKVISEELLKILKDK